MRGPLALFPAVRVEEKSSLCALRRTQPRMGRDYLLTAVRTPRQNVRTVKDLRNGMQPGTRRGPRLRAGEIVAPSFSTSQDCCRGTELEGAIEYKR